MYLAAINNNNYSKYFYQHRLQIELLQLSTTYIPSPIYIVFRKTDS